MPFTGEVILVRAKSMRAWARAESRCETLALAALTCAWETPTWACAAFKASALVFTKARALSPSLWAMNCFSTKLRVRSCARWASVKSTWARETWVWVASRLAWAVNTAARAASTSACAERTRYSKLSGSICASNCPAFTSVLKSTKTSRICPLTCVPTVTKDTGETAPLAATLASKFPRSIFPVRYSTSALAPRCTHHAAPSASSTITKPITIWVFCFIGAL